MTESSSYCKLTSNDGTNTTSSQFSAFKPSAPPSWQERRDIIEKLIIDTLIDLETRELDISSGNQMPGPHAQSIAADPLLSTSQSWSPAGSAVSLRAWIESPASDDYSSTYSTSSKHPPHRVLAASQTPENGPSTQAQDINSRQAESRAMGYARKGQLMIAESLLTKIHWGPSSDSVDRARVELELAAILVQRGRFKDAERQLDDIQLEDGTKSGILMRPSSFDSNGSSTSVLDISLVIWRSVLMMSQGLYHSATLNLERVTRPDSQRNQTIRQDWMSEVQVGINLGLCYAFTGRHRKARDEMDKVEAFRRRIKVADIESVNEKTVEPTAFGKEEPMSTSVILLMDEWTNLSTAQVKRKWMSGKYKEALLDCEAALEAARTQHGRRHFQTLELAGIEAQLLALVGSPSKAEESCNKTLKLMVNELGMEHPATLQTTGHLVDALLARSRFVEAGDTAKSLAKICEAVLGREHPLTLRSLHQVALSYQAIGKYSTAETKLNAVIQIAIETQDGQNYPRTLRFQSDLARVRYQLGKTQSALQLAQATLQSQVRNFESIKTSEGDLLVLPEVLVPHQMLQTYSRALKDRPNVDGDYGVHPDILCNLELLATIGQQDPDSAEFAEHVLKFVCDQRRALFGPDNVTFLESRYQLAQHYQGRNMFLEAEKLLQEVFDKMKEVLSPTNSRTLAVERDLVITYTAQREAPRDLKAAAANIAALHEWQLGKFHPETIKSLVWVLAAQMVLIGEHQEATETLDTVLSRLKDPSVQRERLIESLTTQDNLAWLHQDLHSKAEDLHPKAEAIWKDLIRTIPSASTGDQSVDMALGDFRSRLGPTRD